MIDFNFYVCVHMSVCIGGCLSLKLERGLFGAGKRSGRGRGKIRLWTPCAMQEKGEQLEEGGDEQEGAGLGVRVVR